MLCHRKVVCAFAFLICPLATPIAHAVIIDFENVAPSGTFLSVGNNYVEDGFNLFNPGNTFDAAVVSRTAGFNSTGTDYYGWDSIPTNNPVVLTNILGLNFDFLGLDVAGLDTGIQSSFDIIGHFSAGGILTHNVLNAASFSSVSLGWTALSSVDFDFVSGGFPAIDNLNVTVTAVPEPEIYAMIGLGLGLIGWVGRRKRLKGAAAA